MKKNLFIGLVLIVILFSFCTKEFVNINPVSSQTADDFFKDTTAYSKSVFAIYSNLASVYSNFLPTLVESRSDNIYHGNVNAGGGIQASIQLFGEQTDNSFLLNTYVGLYQVIFNANVALNALATGQINEQNKTVFIGEASFLRALAYFNLVRLWGGVPIITKPIATAQEANNTPRATAAEVYQQIIADLTVANTNLPEAYLATQQGRATKEAATALLGKVYLTMQDWGNATTTLKQAVALHVKNNANIDAMMINANFKDPAKSVFIAANAAQKEEIVFALSYAATTTNGGNFLNAYNNVFMITTDLKSNAFLPGDARIPTTPTAANAAGITKLPTANGTNLANGFPLIRYADVLLMLAEALNEQAYSSASGVAITAANYASMPSAASTTQTAYDLINRVRWRAGLTTLLTESNLDAQLNTKNTVVATTNQEKLRKYIFEERRRELCYEMQRWFDIIRYGTGGIDPKTGSPVTSLGITILNAYVPGATIQRFLYAIPQQEIDVYNNASTFPQNAGY